jgi:hypothetical protein
MCITDKLDLHTQWLLATLPTDLPYVLVWVYGQPAGPECGGQG